MLRENTRAAILELHAKGCKIRRIARELRISRTAVRSILKSGAAEVPRLDRAERGEPYRDRILELHVSCEGNLVRVHEELVKEKCAISYPALTAFCRRHEIGTTPKVPAGQYTFLPGQEMQHDTSPHEVTIAGHKVPCQTASAVLCYSRMMFVQMYPQFRRLECKAFLVDAVRYFGGACKSTMIDNTHVVVLRGSGANMIPVPEMVGFAAHLGFSFAAHEIGDADRSGRVERPFHFIEHNFFPGRTFEDWPDTNRQAREWCDEKNVKPRRSLGTFPRALFLTERLQLQPLPAWIPTPYLLHQRMVDLEGYVSVASNRYSVPAKLIGRRVEVRETLSQIEVFEGPRTVAAHTRLLGCTGRRVFKPEHRPPREHKKVDRTSAEERALLVLVPQLDGYVTLLKKHARGNTTLAIRRLLGMAREYPPAPFYAAVAEAASYGLYDVPRLERMILRRVATDFFQMGDKPHVDEQNP